MLYVGGVIMEMSDYIKNLIKANNLIGEDILNNPSFSEEDLESIRDRIGILIDGLQFWIEQDNPNRFAYDLKKHIQWMIENYS